MKLSATRQQDRRSVGCLRQRAVLNIISDVHITLIASSHRSTRHTTRRLGCVASAASGVVWTWLLFWMRSGSRRLSPIQFTPSVVTQLYRRQRFFLVQCWSRRKVKSWCVEISFVLTLPCCSFSLARFLTGRFIPISLPAILRFRLLTFCAKNLRKSCRLV